MALSPARIEKYGASNSASLNILTHLMPKSCWRYNKLITERASVRSGKGMIFMKRKTKYTVGEDNRQVAIYARKSRITNKGDSIGVQFKQSADYAINQMQLPEDYEFAKYEDKAYYEELLH